ncbi:hypothetical protein [Methylobacterium brachiatum]|uniref:hypothetical protein n=1 Tax=Methylobacterium brachiatum TaxID=269660 RepID=UPI00244C7B1C|nr:hypothetical protein [Methylobacterium brachiatum]MDH2313988.1 hypothetical protein [Methylobacterium brachiatum]
MVDRQLKRKRPKAEDIADLFRVLRGMCFDEKVSDANFRIAFRIAQCVDADTGWGEAGDAFLSDEVPHTDRGKLKRFRRKMRDELGWVTTIKGERGRATRYEFKETRCEEIESARAEAREARHAQSALQKIQRDTAMKVASLGGDITPLTAIEADPITGEIYPLNEPTKGVKSTPVKGAGETPLLPHSSTSPQGYRKQDDSEDAHAHLPASAPMLARADPMRCDCGKPAIVQVRLQEAGPWILQCEECYRDDDCIAFEEEILELNQGSDRQSYAEASRGG